LIFNPGYTLDGTPNVPNSAALAYSRMALLGPRSIACTRRAAKCCRRCASVVVEPSILGKFFGAFISMHFFGSREREEKAKRKEGRTQRTTHHPQRLQVVVQRQRQPRVCVYLRHLSLSFSFSCPSIPFSPVLVGRLEPGVLSAQRLSSSSASPVQCGSPSPVSPVRSVGCRPVSSRANRRRQEIRGSPGPEPSLDSS
jgi:hypothetical protein